MDDITASMNWQRFWTFIELFKSAKVVPLLGIVPDNRDPQLDIESNRDDFWEIMRQLHNDGIVEFSQHGFQHLHVSKTRGILSRNFGFSDKSEFVGLNYEEQKARIKHGQDILKSEEVHTTTWMAPFHSFDETTLTALVDLGFTSVTDGIGLYPWIQSRLTFVPQQLWRPRKMLFGVYTICLHTNDANTALESKVAEHIKSPESFISFSEALKQGNRMWQHGANMLFSRTYGIARRLKNTSS